MIRRIWRTIRRRIQPTKYYTIDTIDALFRFSSPTDEWRTRVQEAMLQLPVTEIDKSDHIRALEVAASVGDSEAILDRLVRAISDDFEDLTAGPEPWEGKFDYVVTIEPGVCPTLHLLTRLFTGIEDGASCYGRVIQRLGPNRFALWIYD